MNHNKRFVRSIVVVVVRFIGYRHRHHITTTTTTATSFLSISMAFSHSIITFYSVSLHQQYAVVCKQCTDIEESNCTFATIVSVCVANPWYWIVWSYASIQLLFDIRFVLYIVCITNAAHHILNLSQSTHWATKAGHCKYKTAIVYGTFFSSSLRSIHVQLHMQRIRVSHMQSDTVLKSFHCA